MSAAGTVHCRKIKSSSKVSSRNRIGIWCCQCVVMTPLAFDSSIYLFSNFHQYAQCLNSGHFTLTWYSVCSRSNYVRSPWSKPNLTFNATASGYFGYNAPESSAELFEMTRVSYHKHCTLPQWVLQVLLLFTTVPDSSINSWDSWFIFNLQKNKHLLLYE